ncbi:MAG: GAF domain-containing protein [Bacteroidetes bacterium]|jgi:polysaccharide biosynthesis protein PelD|nr:GAF domain-containing protein [Bacteroidota bacterium]
MKQLSYLIETIVLLAVLTLINFIWVGDNPGFFGISPHPYWIVVIAISVKYELKQSLIAAFLASLSYSVFLFVSHEISLAEYFKFEAFKPVFLFMIFSSLIGKVRSGQVQKLNKTRKEKKLIENDLIEIRKRYDKVIQINNELSDRITYQTWSFSTIYKMTKKMRTVNIESLFPEALHFISEAIEAEKCSFYVYRNEKLELVSTRGWDEHDERKNKQILTSRLVQQVIQYKEIRAVNDFLNDLEGDIPLNIEGEVVISTPITFGRGNEIFGIINIEKIPFNRFNSDSFSLLKIVSDWISDSLEETDEPLASCKVNQHHCEPGHHLYGRLQDMLKPEVQNLIKED